MQERCNSMANTLALRLSCTNPLIFPDALSCFHNFYYRISYWIHVYRNLDIQVTYLKYHYMSKLKLDKVWQYRIHFLMYDIHSCISYMSWNVAHVNLGLYSCISFYYGQIFSIFSLVTNLPNDQKALLFIHTKQKGRWQKSFREMYCTMFINHFN